MLKLFVLSLLLLLTASLPYEPLQLSDFLGPPSGSYRSSFSIGYSGDYKYDDEQKLLLVITVKSALKQYESYIDPYYSYFLRHIQNEYLLNWITVLDFKLQGEQLFIDLNRDWQNFNAQVGGLWSTVTQKYNSLMQQFNSETEKGSDWNAEKSWTNWIEGRIADLSQKTGVSPVPKIKE